MAYVTSLGGVTAIGTSFPSIHAAWNGGLDGFAVFDTFPSARNGRPLILAKIDNLDPERLPFDHMLDMGVTAARECLAAFDDVDLPPLPVFLSLPSECPGWAEEDANRFAHQLLEKLPVAHDPDRSGFVTSGHHGGLGALIATLEMMRDGQAQACLIGGVQGISANRLDWYEGLKRLKADDAPNGFIPGEGAAFVFLATADFLNELGLPAMAQIKAATQKVEPQPWYMGEPVLGDGMAQVLQELLAPEDHFADFSYADHNGEVWRSEEWSVAYLRTGQKHGHPLDLRHPAQSWGDLGAASGVMLLALASYELQYDRASTRRMALVTCASDQNPFRSGALVAALPPADTRA
ncbi:MAG: hypothetical protein AAFN94_01635 [Pseudomonadota bacterium]